MNFKSVRSLSLATTATGSGSSVSAGSPIKRFSVVYTDSAPGNTLVVQVLLNDGVTWATVQSITTTASGSFSFLSPALDARAAVTAHTVSGNIVADVFAEL